MNYSLNYLWGKEKLVTVAGSYTRKVIRIFQISPGTSPQKNGNKWTKQSSIHPWGLIFKRIMILKSVHTSHASASLSDTCKKSVIRDYFSLGDFADFLACDCVMFSVTVSAFLSLFGCYGNGKVAFKPTEVTQWTQKCGDPGPAHKQSTCEVAIALTQRHTCSFVVK